MMEPWRKGGGRVPDEIFELGRLVIGGGGGRKSTRKLP